MNGTFGHNNCSTFNRTSDTNNISTFTIYNLDPDTISNILYGLLAFSSLTVLCNCIFLLTTWYITIGSKTSILFMRCLALGDILVGIYGIFKVLILQNLDHRTINCFLPESMFISAATIHCFILLWWNTDSYIRLARPMQYAKTIGKVPKTTAMLLLWNIASIVGVLPQIGWNIKPFVCNFFEFYNVVYIILLNIIWSGTTTGSWVMQTFLVRAMRSIRSNTSMIPPNSREHNKYNCINSIIQIDLILWTLSYVPFLLYISIFSMDQRYRYNNYSNINLVFFLAIFMLRSFLSAFVRCYGSLRIRRVVKLMGQDLINAQSADSSSERLSNSSGNNSQASSTVRVKYQNFHRRLLVSPSEVTILEESSQRGIDNMAMIIDTEHEQEPDTVLGNTSKEHAQVVTEQCTVHKPDISIKDKYYLEEEYSSERTEQIRQETVPNIIPTETYKADQSVKHDSSASTEPKTQQRNHHMMSEMHHGSQQNYMQEQDLQKIDITAL